MLAKNFALFIIISKINGEVKERIQPFIHDMSFHLIVPISNRLRDIRKLERQVNV